ncbi:hypothetical protein BVRB_6g134020 isoform B [Beta vulgaris subsp. vulgaris]|nr:hypothetical protein BVRB_6g134020 isoform B [Beta vulgaris subsp. vulgaris]
MLLMCLPRRVVRPAFWPTRFLPQPPPLASPRSAASDTHSTASSPAVRPSDTRIAMPASFVRPSPIAASAMHAAASSPATRTFVLPASHAGPPLAPLASSDPPAVRHEFHSPPRDAAGSHVLLGHESPFESSTPSPSHLHESSPTSSPDLSLVSNRHPMVTRLKDGVSKPRVLMNLNTEIVEYEPTNFKQASKDSRWRQAMLEEYNALIKNDTWELVPRNYDKNLLGCKWVYWIKYHSDGSVERFKARLVVFGNHQQTGIDYFETFSPVVKPTIVRLVLTIGVSLKWSIRQLDVKNAFLHGFLNEEFMHAPRITHFHAVKIKNFQISAGHYTLDYGLYLYSSISPTVVIAYSDADWAGCPDTRCSTTGYVVFLGKNLISWRSKKQPTVSKSSTEAEYRAVAYTAAKTIWLKQLLADIDHFLRRPVIVYCDNVSATYLTANPVYHDRSKHIDVDYHFIREMVAKGGLIVRHVPTQSQERKLPKSLKEELCNLGDEQRSTI